MSWWNDLWLNEGFATYMQYMSLQTVFPQLDIVSSHLWLINYYSETLKQIKLCASPYAWAVSPVFVLRVICSWQCGSGPWTKMH